ncbi:hypothetical protein BDZ91DRAFT_22636 [Kalaharituber pfeilii]|nr:hypothetical protein BDZ91DRAFT_22636 [Kalaharituber pfeilii]
MSPLDLNLDTIPSLSDLASDHLAHHHTNLHKHDFRAASLQPRRYRDHLSRYGYKKRCGKFLTGDYHYYLSGHPIPCYGEYSIPPKGWSGRNIHYTKPTLRTKRYILWYKSRETWRWIGHKCPCCQWYRRQEAGGGEEEILEFTRDGFGLNSDQYVDDNEMGDARCECMDIEGDVEEQEFEVEEEQVEELGENSKDTATYNSPWSTLVDRAVERWERKKKWWIEGLGWEVYSNSERDEDEWSAMMEERGDIGGFELFESEDEGEGDMDGEGVEEDEDGDIECVQVNAGSEDESGWESGWEEL